MSETGLIQILEGALLAAGKPLTVSQLGDLFEEHERPEAADIREALEQAVQRCEERGFELVEVASGYRYQVRQSLSPWVARLWQERPQKYSRALLETLALIAYRQPITRGEIEEIRGVAVSSNIVKTLHEREWIRVVGHRDVPGRPAMYATTRQFLDYFNLKTLEQLPALAEIRDLETLNAELGFEPLPQAESAAGEAEAPEGEIDSDASQAGGPGLTVVGGTDHTPAEPGGSEDGSEQGAGSAGDGSVEAGQGSSTDSLLAPGVLSEAVDELQVRAEEAESVDTVSADTASANTASADTASTDTASTDTASTDTASANTASTDTAILEEPEVLAAGEVPVSEEQVVPQQEQPGPEQNADLSDDVDPEDDTAEFAEAGPEEQYGESSGALDVAKPESQA